MDRLSELPESVIHHLFWLLPMDDVVRTSVLSKRWRSRWTTIPSLNFEYHTWETDHFRDFVTWALARWEGDKILKLKFESSIELLESMHTAIDSWVRIATRHQVEELYINMMLETLTIGGYDPKEGVYSVIQCLYSPCISLKVLSFEHCEFKITRNVQWNQLKRLTITQGLGFTECAVEHILSGSHQLEVLDLSFFAIVAKLNIQSNSLKVLSICMYLLEHDSLRPDLVLSVWAPKLEKLILEGTPYSKCLLTVATSLTHVTIGFSCLHSLDQYGSDFDWDEWDGSDVSAVDYVADKFSQVLLTFQLVDDITLFCGCIKVLGAIKEKLVLSSSSFRNVTCLKIGCCYDDYEQLIGLLEIFPELKWLVLQHVEEDYYQVDQRSLKFDAKSYMNLPSSFLLQLRTVDVTWAEGDNIFPFIEVLLKYASNLQNIVFRVGKNRPPAPPSTLNMASQKLLRMRRSSPICTIEFLSDFTN